MATNFPGSVDNSTSLPYPSSGNFTNGPSLAGGQDNQNDAIIATQTKLGSGASTPSGSNLLVSTGTGTSAWTKVAPVGTIVGTTDSQTLTNKTLTSPTINSPTITNASITTDLITGFTTADTGSIYGVSVAGGIIGSLALANAVNTAAIQSNAVDYTKVAPGFVVQVVAVTYSAASTTTALIPSDDTIPQITEGAEFMTLSITPKSATNRLFIEAKFQGTGNTTPGDVTAALFQDSTANALAVGHAVNASSGYMTVCMIGNDMVAGTTSSTTFRVRAGLGAAGTLTFNGVGGVRRYGGISFSYIKITEYKA